MTPTPGDRWTRPGRQDIEVLKVEGTTVHMKHWRGTYTMTLDEYATCSALSIEKGDTLYKAETEDCYFE